MPLFEALSNAVDAIEARQLSSAGKQISIRVAFENDLIPQEEGGGVINGFDVSDNGIGFTDENLRFFKEAYTLAKVKSGGKGVGRFTFLKVFSGVKVRSIFERSGARFLRTFDFSIDKEVTVTSDATPTDEPLGTTLSVRGMDSKYRSAWSRDPEVLAQRIIEHFLIRFASQEFPHTTLTVPGGDVVLLRTIFETTVQPHVHEFTVNVGDHCFGIQVLRNRDGRARHDITYCANGREVLVGKLRDLLPELPDRFVRDDQSSYTLKVLVTGEYLDGNANQERTDIIFRPENSALDVDVELVKRTDLDRAVSAGLRQVLVHDLRTTNVEKLNQIEEFARRAPEYRVLTHKKYRPVLEQRIQPGLSEDKLDEALLHLRREIEDSVRKEERDVAALMETESFDAYKVKLQELMEKANDVGKAKLADYVAHRRTILDLIEASLKRVCADGKYPFERVLHNMIFPMGVTSKDIFFEQQNLWFIDERLCYHTLLTSDKKLSSIPGLEGTSGKEPDVLAFFYDTPIGVAEPDSPTGGIVILEFKRPGRDNYHDDPANQILQRFREIMTGNVTDVDGRSINPTGIRYVGYLIADLTPTLRAQVDVRYHKTADGEGYFFPLPNGNGYVEIVSYDKLLKDARKGLPRGRRDAALHGKRGVMKKANLGASVRARLLNRARAEKAEFGLMLTRFALERLLYRLSISRHREQFLLKGALLFDLWFDEPHRPTRDADWRSAIAGRSSRAFRAGTRAALPAPRRGQSCCGT